MFDFIAEYSELSGLPVNEIANDYKLILLGGKCVSLTNYIKIICYDDNKVIVKIKGNSLNIEGVKLRIKLLEKKELVIIGSINKIYLSKEFINDKA